jgi:hypothetical protein
MTYNGTCAYRNRDGGAWGPSRTEGFCLVQPGSCKVGDCALGCSSHLRSVVDCG